MKGVHGSRSFLILFVMIIMTSSSISSAAIKSDHHLYQPLNTRKFLINNLIINNIDDDDAAAAALAEVIFTSTGDQDDDLLESNKYAVIFDAGSTGTRVHVFRFDSRLNLRPITNGGQGFEFYNKTVPGLSAYADNPKAAADSIKLLLNQSQELVPTELRPQTPVRLGATAGLRLISNDAAERILEAVRELFKTESGLNNKAEWVTIIDGFQEGSYIWVTVNYLLENLGKPYQETVGVMDLGGGSVQMNYAISQKTAANAPKTPSGENNYLAQWYLNGTTYYLYAHSYLRYGLESSRAEILRLTSTSEVAGNPCVINGYQGTYEYGGEVFQVSSSPKGTNRNKCRALVKQALNLCPYKNCTFSGNVWNGGGGDGQNILYITTSFYFTAASANIVDQSMKTWTTIYPSDYLKAAKIACKANITNVKTMYPYARDADLPYICMDLVYVYSLLVDGFGLRPMKEVRVVNKMDYKGFEFDAAWPLGAAIDALSPATLRLTLYK